MTPKERLGMWGQALKVIPAVTKAQWEQFDVITRWLVATRSAVLVMTFVSAAVAGLLAFRDAGFDPWVWVLLCIGLVFAHAANNLVNDFTDYAKGVDSGNYFRAQYGPQPLEHGLMTRATMLRYIGVTLGIALAAGIALVVMRGGATLTLLGIGLVFVLFYTWPMKFIGLGEVAVLAVWGPLMVGGGYYVLTGQWDLDVLLASLPLSLGATVVIFGKHIDKLDQDQAKGIRTLPVLLGDPTSRLVARAMLVLQYGVVAWLVTTGYFMMPVLIVLGATSAMSRANRALTKPRPATAPADWPPGVWPLYFVAMAFVHTRKFGLYYLVGIVIDVVLHHV